LKYHRVGEPVSRGFILDGKQPHTTPVIVISQRHAMVGRFLTKAMAEARHHDDQPVEKQD